MVNMAIFEGNGKTHIFKNKRVFSKDYIPNSILHRDDQIKQIADGLRYILDGQRPTDQIIYGKRGTGKTLVARHVIDELIKIMPNVRVFYVSLKHARTEFLALDMIIEKIIGKNLSGKSIIRGNSFSYGCNLFFDYLSKVNEKNIILILDEINKIENPDMLLHTLLRPNEVYGDMKGKEVSYIFISNDPVFPGGLSEGTRSSYTGVTKRVFPAYLAPALRDILTERVNEGLMPGVCSDDVIGLCAAHGAQEEGDARETIQLLEKAAEIAIENNSEIILEDHVRLARKQVEFDGLVEVIKTLPTQQKAVALACIWDIKFNNTSHYTSTTGSVYNVYKDIVHNIGIEILTQRRITDFLDELAGLGFIEAIIKSKGRRGRTKEVSVLTSFDIEEVLIQDYRLQSMKDYRPRSRI